MISGPTILLYKVKYWNHTSHYNNLTSNLKKAKILFEDPLKAARHINKGMGGTVRIASVNICNKLSIQPP